MRRVYIVTYTNKNNVPNKALENALISNIRAASIGTFAFFVCTDITANNLRDELQSVARPEDKIFIGELAQNFESLGYSEDLKRWLTSTFCISAKFDTTAIEGIVSTQYEDLGGIIKIDGYEGSIDFFNMCQEHDIDMKKYFLYGVSLYDGGCDGICGGRYMDNKEASAKITVYLIDKQIYGSSFDEIRNYQGKIQLVKKEFEMAYSEWKNYIKRLSIGVVSPLSKEIDVIMPEED